MILKFLNRIIIGLFLGTLIWSCEDDLNVLPEDDRLTSDKALVTTDDYKSFLAKIYGGISLSGQQGPEGDGDIAGISEDFSGYLRLYFQLQELPTDEAVIAWNDATIQALNQQTWTPADDFSGVMYSRIYFQVAVANTFLRLTEPSTLSSSANAEEIRVMRAEARFMRALSYWHALDLYGSPTIITDKDPSGSFFPPQTNPVDLFGFIESELLAIEDEMVAPMANEYGRADRAAVWALLSKLYLNSEVYLGEGNGRFNDCIDVCNKIINAGYSIDTSLPYSYLFLADNDTNGAQNEAIFTIPFDGINTRSSGGMTYLVHAAVGGSMDVEDYGINNGWAGLRTTEVLVNLFGEPTNADADPSEQRIWEDTRLIAHTPGQSLEIPDLTVFSNGYAIGKYKNIKSDGTPGKDPAINPDTDFHMFRLADIYLTYAEATLEGASNGDLTTALSYVNTLRERAFGDSSQNITISELTLDFILDERARELYWECHRRTDLIRHNQYSENGIWPFKGGVPGGQRTPKFRDLYPIPQKEIDINPNPIQQNRGYN